MRSARAAPLTVAFIALDREEYGKFWVAPFLYDRRIRSADATSLPDADLAVAAPDTRIPSFVRREQLHLGGGIVRDVLVRER